MNLKAAIRQIFIFTCLSQLHLSLFSQDKVSVSQNNLDNIIEINKAFFENSEINPFKSGKTISGLTISFDIQLNADVSLARVTLMDDKNHEYLVCEIYPLLIDSSHVSLADYTEETAFLNNVVPVALNIELINASIQVKGISIDKKEKRAVETVIKNKQQQKAEKIKRLNRQIRQNGGLWIAGETSISGLSYEEKKAFFGGSVPNLQGFEYYSGGIFGFIDDSNETLHELKVIDSAFVTEFDWRNRHGANHPNSPYFNGNPGSHGWITPVKNQGGCGSCWIFGPTAAIEAMVNLYFNQHIDVDLSEQEVLSCSGGTCYGASSSLTLMFARGSGIVTEICFPYVQEITDCSNKCINPSEKIIISDFINLDEYSYEQIKKELIKKGPIAGNVNFWSGAMGHSMCLIGFGRIEAGDTIYADGNSSVIVNSDDPVVGKTYLIFKNSWGASWGEEGYACVLEESLDRVCLYTIVTPIFSNSYNVDSISCNDYDGDGYYYWGLGPKPQQCPVCPDLPDGDDSNPCTGPMDDYGNLMFFTPLPLVKDTTVLAGSITPDLFAEGETINWYADKNKNELLHTGSSFPTGRTSPGKYIFYATQTRSNCESDVQPVILEILLEVRPPIADDVTVYKGESIPDMVAYGENVKWYADKKNPLYDNRDGQAYETTLIGEQLWMAENLNFYTPTGSWFYEHDSASFSATYGRLYSYQTALSACPVEWHLPSDEEWMDLELHLGMTWREAHSFMKYRGETTGSILKEKGTMHWTAPNQYATDEAGFKARPAGSYHFVNDDFDYIGTRAVFLTSTKYSESEYYIRDLIDYSEGIGRWCNSYQAYSVRCMRNLSDPVYAGNSFKPSYILPGKYIYYVTQTISGIESPAGTVILTILNAVRPPKAEDITVCAGHQVPGLIAQGNDVRWYSDAQLTHLLHEGNVYHTGQTDPGNYAFYVTQSLSGEQSLPDTVLLTIKPVPAAPAIQDLTVCEGEMNMALQATGENIKWYDANDTLFDTRDGKVYNTVRIGNQTWMAENLNTGTPIDGTLNQTDNHIVEKYCYNDDPENCRIFGGLYQWNELMNYSVQENTRGICPSGWHVPSHGEWKMLEIALGMFSSCADSFGFRGTDQGTQLISGGHGFNALMAGKRIPDGTFAALDSYCTYWNSTGYNRSISVLFPEIYASQSDHTANGFSLRCVKDDSSTVATGNSYNPGQTKPGEYNYQVTQSIMGCESPAASVLFTVAPAPSIVLVNDTAILRNQGITLGPFNTNYSYLWDDGSDNPFLEISGNEIGMGNHAISVKVTDTTGCTYSDTLMVDVINCAYTKTIAIESCYSYTSPGGKTWTLSGEYFDTIPTPGDCDSVINVNLTIYSVDTSVSQDQSVLTANAAEAAYQWIRCGNGNAPVEGETHQSFAPAENGSYAVIISQHGCVDTSACFDVRLTGVSTLGYKPGKTLYPNPNDGSFSVDLGKVCTSAEITITEMDGRIIQKNHVLNSRHIDLQLAASPGLYMVIVTAENESAVFSMLKK